MIGVWMRVEDPFHGQAVLLHIIKHGISMDRRDRAGLRIKIEHGIDNRALFRFRTGRDVLDGIGTRVVKALNNRTSTH